MSASALGETGTVVDSGYDKSSSVSLVRLVQVQTGGSEEVAGPWCALNARAEVGNGRSFTSRSGSGSYTTTTHITGLFQAFTSYGPQIDTRGVRITRSGAPAPKQANDPTLKKELDEWIDSDGTGHGHTTYSYFYWQWSEPIGSGAVPGQVKSHNPNIQNFMANLTDGQSHGWVVDQACAGHHRRLSKTGKGCDVELVSQQRG